MVELAGHDKELHAMSDTLDRVFPISLLLGVQPSEPFRPVGD